VRELRNVVERLVILSEDNIGVGDLPEEIVAEVSRGKRPVQALGALELPAEAKNLPLRELRDLIERQYVLAKLDENEWNISRTAQVLGLERTNLHKKMRALGIARDDRRE
jgi:DNA-binding NtrC family response regulator